MDLLEDVIPSLGMSFDAFLLRNTREDDLAGSVVGSLPADDDSSSGCSTSNSVVNFYPTSSSESVGEATSTTNANNSDTSDHGSESPAKVVKRSKRVVASKRAKNSDEDDGDFSEEANVTRKKGRKASKPTASASSFSAATSIGDGSVTLSRERLLTVSSAEYEEYLSSLQRAFTADETNEVRRQRRLIKNRESAALSRNRKKHAMELLEEENATLRKELAAVRARLERYEPSARLAGALFVVLFSVGLCFSAFGSAATSIVASSHVSQPQASPNLRKLMSVQANDMAIACANETGDDLHFDTGCATLSSSCTVNAHKHTDAMHSIEGCA